MTVIFMDFPQNLSDLMPEKSHPIAHNRKQNVLVYRTWQNLLKFLQGVLGNSDNIIVFWRSVSKIILDSFFLKCLKI